MIAPSLDTLPRLRLVDRNELPRAPGIYWVVVSGEVLYIGAATNLRQRWYRHHRQTAIDALGDAEIAYLLVPDVDEMAGIEEVEILAHAPRLNRPTYVPYRPGKVDTTLVNILMTPEELAELDEWRFNNRFAARAEAMRWLIRMGMKAKPKLSPEDRRAIPA